MDLHVINTITDTSYFNSIEVSEIIKISKDRYLEELRGTIEAAKTKGLKITVCGAKHTQGGHIAYQQGLVLDLSNLMHMHMVTGTLLRVQAGATWKQVIQFLHARGLSVDIMQSDHDFTIGGTVSANAHGWQANKPPIIASIQGFHILTADGQILSCTRETNADLFKAAIGGYGLLGIIIDVDFVVVKNNIYKLRQTTIPVSNFLTTFKKFVKENAHAEMFLGHFTITRKYFLKKMIFLVYEDSKNPSDTHHLSEHGLFKKLKWWLFAKTYRSGFYKNVRAKMERIFMDGALRKLSRNKLLYRTVNDYFNKDPQYTDLLQEYFVPVDYFDKFITFLQSLESDLTDYLLNITVRHVQKDTESILHFAHQEMVGFVFYFRGERTAHFDTHLKTIAKKITEYALQMNGSYYLPYRPCQTREQFEKAYPQHEDFRKIKLKYDPDTLFCNQFYKKYFMNELP